MSTKYDVFISYASESQGKAVILEALLRKQGLKVFLDKNVIKWGDNILKVIANGLKESKGYLLIIDTYFLTKGWPLFERDSVLNLFIKGYADSEKHMFAILADDYAMEEWKKSPFTGMIRGHGWSDDPAEQEEMARIIAGKLRAEHSA